MPGGRQGWLQIDTTQRYPKPAGFPGPKFAIGWTRSHMACLYDFLKHIADNTPCDPDFSAGARINEIMDAACRSSEKGAWVGV